MKKRVPLGQKSYEKLKTGNYYVVDKSLMIKDYLDKGNEVTLITRPRRFGKTINMSRRCPPLVCCLNFLIAQRMQRLYLRIQLS